LREEGRKGPTFSLRTKEKEEEFQSLRAKERKEVNSAVQGGEKKEKKRKGFSLPYAGEVTNFCKFPTQGEKKNGFHSRA